MNTSYYIRINGTIITDFPINYVGIKDIFYLSRFMSSFENSEGLILELMKKGIISPEIDISSEVEVVKKKGRNGKFTPFLSQIMFFGDKENFFDIIDLRKPKRLKEFLCKSENANIVGVIVRKYSQKWFNNYDALQNKLKKDKTNSTSGAKKKLEKYKDRMECIREINQLLSKSSLTSEEKNDFEWYIDRFLHFVMHNINTDRLDISSLILIINDVYREKQKNMERHKGYSN